jgi:hypothetical protein
MDLPDCGDRTNGIRPQYYSDILTYTFGVDVNKKDKTQY